MLHPSYISRRRLGSSRCCTGRCDVPSHHHTGYLDTVNTIAQLTEHQLLAVSVTEQVHTIPEHRKTSGYP